jgi:hypothetical protein
MATLTATLLLSLGTAVAQERPASDDTDRKPPGGGGGGWWSHLWPFGHKAEEKKTPPPEPEPRRPSVAESARVVRALEEAALHRRVAVCYQLLDVAYATHDQQLQHKAEELQNLAWEIYTIRTAHLPSGGPSGSADERALGRHLGPGSGGLDASALTGGSGARDEGWMAQRRDR